MMILALSLRALEVLAGALAPSLIPLGTTMKPRGDAKTFVNTLASLGEPIQQQLATYLKSKDAEVTNLKQKSKAFDQRAHTQQLIHNYGEKGNCDWHFATDDIGFLCECFIMPGIFDPDTRQYFEQLLTNNWEA